MVERAKHLGHVLHQDGQMRQDCQEKRAQFIDSSVKLREAFSFGHPYEQILSTKKYCTARAVWKQPQEAMMVFAAWRTGHKVA